MKTEKYFYDSLTDVILIPGKVYGPFIDQNIKLVFDPGAYRTIIDTTLIDSIGYQASSRSKKATTRSIIGTEYGYITPIQKLSILSFEFNNIEIACFDLPEQYQVDGLLGLDLLEKFEITLRHKERWIQFRLLE